MVRLVVIVMIAPLVGCGSRTGLLVYTVEPGDGGEESSTTDAALDGPKDGPEPDTLRIDGGLEGGACAPGEALCGGKCTSQRCPITQFKVPFPVGIAVNSSNVYWGEVNGPQSASIANRPLGGGARKILWKSADGRIPYAIAVGQDHVFWNCDDGSVMKVTSNGGVGTVLAEGVTGTDQSYSDIAMDGTNVYSAVGTTFYSYHAYPQGVILSVPISGGAPTTIVSAKRLSGALAVDATNIYWADEDGVMKRSLAGGEVVTIASPAHTPTHLAVDAASVYWLADDGVMSVPLDGGAVTTLVSANLAGDGSLWPLAIDTSSIYWCDPGATNGTFNLMQTPKSGGRATMLASGLSTVDFIAVTASTVYWTEPYAGEVLQLATK